MNGSFNELSIASDHSAGMAASAASASYAEDIISTSSRDDVDLDLDPDVDFSSSAGYNGDEREEEPLYPPQTPQERLAAKASRDVMFSKILVYFVVITAGVGGCLATLYLVKSAQNSAYTLSFLKYAEEVASVTNASVGRSFLAVHALSNSIMATATNAKATFPFFTQPDFGT